VVGGGAGGGGVCACYMFVGGVNAVCWVLGAWCCGLSGSEWTTMRHARQQVRPRQMTKQGQGVKIKGSDLACNGLRRGNGPNITSGETRARKKSKFGLGLVNEQGPFPGGREGRDPKRPKRPHGSGPQQACPSVQKGTTLVETIILMLGGERNPAYKTGIRCVAGSQGERGSSGGTRGLEKKAPAKTSKRKKETMTQRDVKVRTREKKKK